MKPCRPAFHAIEADRCDPCGEVVLPDCLQEFVAYLAPRVFSHSFPRFFFWPPPRQPSYPRFSARRACEAIQCTNTTFATARARKCASMAWWNMVRAKLTHARRPKAPRNCSIPNPQGRGAFEARADVRRPFDHLTVDRDPTHSDRRVAAGTVFRPTPSPTLSIRRRHFRPRGAALRSLHPPPRRLNHSQKLAGVTRASQHIFVLDSPGPQISNLGARIKCLTG